MDAKWMRGIKGWLFATLALLLVFSPFSLSAKKNKGLVYAGTQFNYEDIYAPYDGQIYGGGLLFGAELRNLNLQFGLYYDELYGDDAQFFDIGDWDYNAWLISAGMNLRWNFNPNQPVIVWADGGVKAGTGIVHFQHSDDWGEFEFHQPITTSTIYGDLGVTVPLDKHWRLEAGVGIGFTGMYLDSGEDCCSDCCCDCSDYDENADLISYYGSSRAFVNVSYGF